MGQICGLGEINFQIGEEEEKKKSFPDEPNLYGGEDLRSGCVWRAVAEAVPNFSWIQRQS